VAPAVERREGIAVELVVAKEFHGASMPEHALAWNGARGRERETEGERK
jgi:hypothetical protein